MRRALPFVALLLALSGCADFQDAPAPDYRIGLAPLPGGGMKAVAPTCPGWTEQKLGALQNDPWPQYGCASARNLAAMVDDPHDLIEGRPMGNANAETTSGAMSRYITNKTKPLINPNDAAPANAATGGGNDSAASIGAAVAAGVGAGAKP